MKVAILLTYHRHKHNYEELQQKNRHGTVSNKLLGGGGGAEMRFTGSKPFPSASAVMQKSFKAS